MFYLRILCVMCLVLALPAQQVFAQDEEDRYELSGRVYDQDSITPLSMAYVIIRRSEGGAATDLQGRFLLYVKRSDTIQISYTGLEPRTIPVENLVKPGNKKNELYITVYMRPLVVKLRQATVFAMRPTPSRISDQEYYEGMIKSYTVKPSMNFSNGFAVQGALSALIAPFTHKGKEMIKFEQLYMKMETQRVVNKRFNEDLVHDVTGMNYEDIPDFKKFCGFSNEFVLASSDYDFLFAIRKAYDRYLYSKYGIRQQR